MTHAEFTERYREGALKVTVDPAMAARFVSARMLLPFVLLPVFGAGVALALVGHWIAGIALFVAGIAFRFLVRRSAPGFVVRHAIASAKFYEEVQASGMLRLDPGDTGNTADPGA